MLLAWLASKATAPVLALQVAGIKVKASYVQDLLRPPSLEKPLFVKPHNF